jgi:hypothetical protein
VVRIHCEQGVQQSGAAAGQADDEERFADFLSHNVWIRLPIALHEQTRTQRPYDIRSKDNSPDQIKFGLALAGIQ